MKEGAASLAGVRVNVKCDNNLTLPTNGDDYSLTTYVVTLIDKVSGADTELLSVESNADNDHKPTIGVANNALQLSLPVIQINNTYFEQMKSVSETKIASLAMVRNSDGVINHCIENVFAQPVHAIAMFGEASAAANRVNSGSYVDTRGFSAVAGFGLSGNFDESKLLVGAFTEFGSGTYDSHNDYKNAPSVKGEGKTRYIGGGIMGRFSINTSDNSKFYFDAVGRIGSSKMDYKSSGIQDYATGKTTSYDINSGYCGLSAGCGHIHNIDDFNFNLYCRYIWTHQNGNKVTLSTGKYMEIDAMSSQRIQAGLMLSHKVADTISIYLDTGYEHESSGKVNAKINGHPLDSPSLRGNVGKSELGLSFIDETVSVNVGVQGSLGACRGIAGKLQISFQL
jgi:outer membrane autotransporter protein